MRTLVEVKVIPSQAPGTVMIRYMRLWMTLLLIVVAYAPKASAQVEVTTSLWYSSPYVWRGEVFSTGFVLQPEIEMNYRDFSLVVFGNLDPQGTQRADKFHVNEVDLTAGYGLSMRGVSFGGGYTLYTFPTPVDGDLDLSPSHEVFAHVSLDDVIVAPRLLVAYDFTAYQGMYAEAGVSSSLDLGGQPLTFSADLGFDAGYVLPAGEVGLSHLVLTTTADLAAGRLTISPLIGLQVTLLDAYKELNFALTRGVHGKGTMFFGGIGIGF
jgi:hypothetical protein